MCKKWINQKEKTRENLNKEEEYMDLIYQVQGVKDTNIKEVNKEKVKKNMRNLKESWNRQT